MLQKLPANNFEWLKGTSQLNKDFIKNYNEESDEGYFDDMLMFNILKKYKKFIMICHVLPERMIIENIEKLVTT